MDKKTVLVVEDSPYLAESLADMLNIKGHEAIIAQSGREGVELAIEKKPDLILLDIRLPDIDGYEVYRRIRETDWGKKAKVVVLTASESIDNISKNIDLPKEFILFKPEWAASDLMEKIENVLKD
ncbi:response regulator [Candidatus Nomurabacteria bacterium]|nr:response regulator [Candidatus Kaiserbacteria bacterium]MCB9815722.1 response regulator [Candidatus Nomurabacteria bacterium]